jgi:hypothetical protein
MLVTKTVHFVLFRETVIVYCEKDWIDLAQGRDRWRALVYTVMNLRVP